MGGSAGEKKHEVSAEVNTLSVVAECRNAKDSLAMLINSTSLSNSIIPTSEVLEGSSTGLCLLELFTGMHRFWEIHGFVVGSLHENIHF